MKLIDKDVLTERLWERKIKHRDFGGSPYSEYGHEDDEILSLINSLEVKEVDLEKEIKRLWEKHSYLNMDCLRPVASLQFPEFSDIAKHFFELGLRSTITEEDCKLIWNIGDEIPNRPEEEFFKELLKRFKAQKVDIVMDE